MDRDEIGTLGQDMFKTWCTPAGATAIPASSDKHGWDFFVQMVVPGGPADPPERCCKVQVKTTTTDDPTASIKLSNWKRMALERTPWFVLHIVLEGPEASRVYLVHVDERQVARVLERLRTLDPSTDLRETRMSVTPSNDDLLSQPFHSGLRHAMMRHLGPSEDEYVSRKRSWIQGVGFTEHPYTYTFSMDTPDEATCYQQLAQWAVGLIEHLPIAALKVAETRFGISLPVKDVEGLTGGHLALEGLPSIGISTVTLSNRDRSEVVILDCTTHIARAVIRSLPEKHDLFRLVAPFVSFLQSVKDDVIANFEVSFSIPGEGVRLPLREISKACKCADLFSRAPRDGLLMQIGMDDVKGRFDLSAASFDPDPEFVRFIRVIEGAALVGRFFDLDSGADIDPNELLRREFQVKLVASGIDGSVRNWDLRVGIAADEEVHGKPAAILLAGIVPIGKHVVAAGFALVGTANWARVADGTRTISVDRADVRVAFKQVVPREEWDGATVDPKLRAFAKTLRAEGVEVIVV